MENSIIDIYHTVYMVCNGVAEMKKPWDFWDIIVVILEIVLWFSIIGFIAAFTLLMATIFNWPH